MGRKKKDRTNKIIIGFEGTLPLKVRLEEEAEKRYMSLSALIYLHMNNLQLDSNRI